MNKYLAHILVVDDDDRIRELVKRDPGGLIEGGEFI